MGPVVRRVVQLLGLTAMQALALFGSAGTLGWPAAWVYIGVYVGLLLVGAVMLRGSGREVIAERSRGVAGAKAWDLTATRVLRVTSMGLLVVSGLAVRWDWHPRFGAVAADVGVVLLVVGYVITLRAMAANTFFSQVVRIQTERGHVVASDGPYRFVRHPGYVGMIACTTGIVLLLGSPWAVVPFAGYLATMVVRTRLEDQTLTAELPGYREYAQRTRFRLVPGVW